MAMHDGHRQRLRKRYLQSNLLGFDDLAILELLLCFAIPRRDTNPIAHHLLDRFGSLAAVLEATPEELQQVEGVGESAAVLLTLVPAVARRHMEQRAQIHEPLRTTGQLAAYLAPRFFGERDEVVWLLCLDARLRPLDCRLLFRGSVNSSAISVRKIVEVAMGCGASSVVLAHNHTSGLAVASREDERTTQRLKAALDAVDILLADHIIIAGDDYVSMAASGCLY